MSKKKTPHKKSHSSRVQREERTRRDARSRGSESPSRKKRDGKESDSDQSALSKIPSQAAIRETIESVVIAFILAFLFRTFEAEAFVIPTGSMAPTLMGRHKDVECPECGCWYQVSASREIDKETGKQTSNVTAGTCPMCRYTMPMKPTGRYDQRYDSFSGDRILVDKFLYQFMDPERWDVAVFKFPGGAKMNYIKRIVGLPNEWLKISHGDLFTKPHDEGEESNGEFTIAQKPPDKLRAMLQPVFDNDYAPKQGWPPRWKAESLPGDTSGVWEPDEPSSFHTTGEAPGERWLRYEHRVPNDDQWRKLKESQTTDGPKPQLISDGCAYNTNEPGSILSGRDVDALGLHWVGDLALCCTLEVESDSGEAALELVEGGWRMQCLIDVATGVATLRIVREDGTVLDDFRPTAETDIRGGTKHKVLFANVDDQLLLWVDKPGGRGLPRRLVEFDSSTTYSRPDYPKPTDDDLSPVGIGTNGARLRVGHLKVLRDIYYIADTGTNSNSGLLGSVATDFKQATHPALKHQPQLMLKNPEFWDMFDDDNMQEVIFDIGNDRFVVLGDNSAKSEDCRLWDKGKVWNERENYVSRELLIGKALFIYWPHSWDKAPGTHIPFPFFPNFSDMGFVR